MKLFPTKIGEFIFHIYNKTNAYNNFLHTNFFSHKNLQFNSPDLIITIMDNYGVSFVNYDVAIKKELNKILYERADYLIEVNNSFKYATISVHNELALKHALMNLYSAFLVHHNWGLLVHSSCVVEHGTAHLFAGHSGAGKSTVAMLSKPRNLLSDEATILKISEDGVTIYDSPFRSELKPLNLQESYPLKSMQLLSQALINKRITLHKADALIQLIDKVFYWPYCAEETTRIINLLKLLVEKVPIYELHFQKDNTFWELIS
jgi:hypothetical protein